MRSSVSAAPSMGLITSNLAVRESTECLKVAESKSVLKSKSIQQSLLDNYSHSASDMTARLSFAYRTSERFLDSIRLLSTASYDTTWRSGGLNMQRSFPEWAFFIFLSCFFAHVRVWMLLHTEFGLGIWLWVCSAKRGVGNILVFSFAFTREGYLWGGYLVCTMGIGWILAANDTMRNGWDGYSACFGWILMS